MPIGEGWGVDVDRGPNWVFLRVKTAGRHVDETPKLAEGLWDVVRTHLTYRVVLELDQLPELRSHVIGQLTMLSKRVHNVGGTLRLSGLSSSNEQVLKLCRLDRMLPAFPSRNEAVQGRRESATC